MFISRKAGVSVREDVRTQQRLEGYDRRAPSAVAVLKNEPGLWAAARSWKSKGTDV